MKRDTPSEECVRLLEQINPKDAEIRKLRSEVRRLRGWIRHWSKRYDESSAGYIVCVPTCDDYDDALLGKPAPKVKR